MTRCEIAIVGAGVSGLTLGRALRGLGHEPVILDRARGVGGRCATRRVEGVAVDHGPAFLHGRDPRFLAELDAMREVTPIPGWPRTREGSGLPCQPEAFEPGERRVALREGLSRFAKHLALGLDVRLDCEVVGLLRAPPGAAATGQGWELTLGSGERLHARALALALPAPGALELLRGASPASAALEEILPLIALVRMLPCLAVIARYPAEAPPPPWEASYPEGDPAVQGIFHDSSKRLDPGATILVIQAGPKFSRVHHDEPSAVWSGALLGAAAAIHGGWITNPAAIQAHTWHHARVDPISALASPLALALERGEILGVCGDGFSIAGGLEGAYLSGLALAARLSPMIAS